MKIYLDKREEKNNTFGGETLCSNAKTREAQAEGDWDADWSAERAVGSGSGREFYGQNKTPIIRALNGRIGRRRANCPRCF